MISAVIYAIKTTAKKKPENIPEFKFFRFLFHNLFLLYHNIINYNRGTIPSQ